MSPEIAEHDVTVLLGDVREQLATLPDESVNCVVTSPPYYGLRDYGVDGQIGLEASPAEYVETMRSVFAEVRRVLRPDGTCWLNVGDTYVANSDGYLRGADPRRAEQPARRKRETSGRLPDKNLRGMPWRVAFALQDDGWTLRNDIVWAKPNGMPESVADRLSCRHEHVFLLAKARRYWFDLEAIKEPLATTRADGHVFGGAKKASGLVSAGSRDGGTARRSGNTYDTLPDGGRNPGDVWAISTSPFPGAHFATMPPELARRCILAGCPQDGVVLDPFAGSGTTLMVARQTGRRAIGIELNPAYIEIIRERIGQTPFDFGASA